MPHTLPLSRFITLVRRHWRSAVDAAVTTIVLAAAVTILRTHLLAPDRAPHPSRVSPRHGVVKIENSPVRGNRLAHVAVLEYSDFQCPFCARAVHQVIPVIDSEYVATGKVLFVFRHNPLTSLHPSALAAATAAECARRQGRFWELHDRLFSRNGNVDANAIREDASSSGVEIRQWDGCMANGDAKTSVEREAKAARAIGVVGTPTFLIGALGSGGSVTVASQITGVGTTAEWRSALDAALTRSQ